VCEDALRCEECAEGRAPGEKAKAVAVLALVRSALTRLVGMGGAGANGFG